MATAGGARPELAFLTQRIPYPPNKGDKIRSWHLLAHLARHYTVHLGCLVDDPDDWQHLPELERLCASVHAAKLEPRRARLRSLRGLVDGRPLTLPYFFDRGLARWVDRLHRDRPIAAQLVYCSSMVPYAERVAGFGRGAPGLRVIDFMDVDSDKWAQYARSRGFPGRWIYGRESRRLALAERDFARRADVCLLVSDAEAALFRERTGLAEDRVRGMSNGVDIGYFDPARAHPSPYPPGGPVLVFTGMMDYWANIDAVTWLAEQVLPRLRERAGGVRLAIAGARPAPAIRRLGEVDPEVLVTGRVADIRPYVAHADIVVAPLRIARGVQNKVLEGMAMAKPVVATPQAFEGIRATPTRHLLIADGAERFADAVVGLLGDAAGRARLGAAAREHVAATYTWASQLARLDDVLPGAAARQGDAA